MHSVLKKKTLGVIPNKEHLFFECALTFLVASFMKQFMHSNKYRSISTNSNKCRNLFLMNVKFIDSSLLLTQMKGFNQTSYHFIYMYSFLYINRRINPCACVCLCERSWVHIKFSQLTDQNTPTNGFPFKQQKPLYPDIVCFQLYVFNSPLNECSAMQHISEAIA